MSGFVNYLHTHRKAIAGGVLAAASAVVAHYWGAGSPWVAVIAAAAGVLGVGAIPNRKHSPGGGKPA